MKNFFGILSRLFHVLLVTAILTSPAVTANLVCWKWNPGGIYYQVEIEEPTEEVKTLYAKYELKEPPQVEVVTADWGGRIMLNTLLMIFIYVLSILGIVVGSFIIDVLSVVVGYVVFNDEDYFRNTKWHKAICFMCY